MKQCLETHCEFRGTFYLIKMDKTKTEIFIIKAILIHGDRYDYSKVEYVNAKTKILIKCKIHNIWFYQNPDNLKRKIGCPLCKKEKIALSLENLREVMLENFEFNDELSFVCIEENYECFFKIDGKIDESSGIKNFFKDKPLVYEYNKELNSIEFAQIELNNTKQDIIFEFKINDGQANKSRMKRLQLLGLKSTGFTNRYMPASSDIYKRDKVLMKNIYTIDKEHRNVPPYIVEAQNLIIDYMQSSEYLRDYFEKKVRQWDKVKYR